ncbi:FecR domain-containing protein [Chitinophaga sp.]|uniref:FecR family protein n=1 Tax=Chitinophaga sp. TaxID=1869181 RepID=UPI0031E3CDA5
MTEKDTKFAQDLLKRYNEGRCTEAERRLVDAWFNHQARLNDELPERDDMHLIGQEIWSRLPVKDNVVRRMFWKRTAVVTAAAAVLLVLLYLTVFHQTPLNKGQYVAKAQKGAISPGTYGATLTLGNGTQVALGSVKNGVFAEDSTVRISKSAKGELIYQVKGVTSDRPQNNTLSTAKGQTFKVDLPDGSSVWLNSASSLTYSTNLANAALRSVRLTGEAYFKVAKNTEHPFVVKIAGHEVRVLGTEFNVNAYPNDDAETTTLINGSVRLSTSTQQITLVPGEQGSVSNGKIEKSAANVYAATGWKSNEFVFASQDIRSIMKMISRWYDVDIIYEGNVTTEKISGSISRFADLHSVLNILQATGTVKFQINGNSITVSENRK